MDKKILGSFGELLVEKRLASKGHKILARQYKKWGGEIDIISVKSRNIYFNEVKTRAVSPEQTLFGLDLASIGLNRKKMSNIIRCAEHYISEASPTVKKYKWQLDAYLLEIKFDHSSRPANSLKFLTIDEMKGLFKKGEISVSVTTFDNINREVF